MSALAAVVLALLASVCLVSSSPTQYTCSLVPGRGFFTVQTGYDASGVAWASYDPAASTTGWAFLNLSTNPKYSDADQMYAAGYLEGAITTDLIWASYYNTFVNEYNSTAPSSKLNDWITNNVNFMNSQIKANPTDPYWTHVYLVLTQLEGMVDGYSAYNKVPAQKLTEIDFWILNMDGDMEDLSVALNLTSLDWSDHDAVARRALQGSHCSSLVHVTPDMEELFAGHTTWTFYYEMVRIFKTYDFALSTPQSSPVSMFSSYPGALSSIDDFYQTSSQLVVMETTNGVMNASLFSAIAPNTVLSWIRVIVANKMASSGQEWVNIFSKLNSGTYNNQWIVVDMKKFVRGISLQPGTLFILEQIPGYIESADVTGILSYGYWPSYNVPFFPYIYNVSGFAPFAKLYGPVFAYQNNPRAEIFRRDANTVQDIKAFNKLMRYNDYSHDPLAHGNAGNAISSRFDLNPNNKTNPFWDADAFGGTDSKTTSATSIARMQCYIQGGPTHDNHLPPFKWSSSAWHDEPHVGQPDVWDFDWITLQYSP